MKKDSSSFPSATDGRYLFFERDTLMKRIAIAMATSAMLVAPAIASEHGHSSHHGGAHSAHAVVADSVIAEQRTALAESTEGKGFGPQSPRDIDAIAGSNKRLFDAAPAYTAMNLCNIHFHKNAEHKGKDFSTYAGNGNGEGYQSGYKYSGELTKNEQKKYHHKVCNSTHSTLNVGDTIEVHYVHSTAQVIPGKGLGSCLSEAIKNPQLRVETQVYVLVNDKHALDFNKLTAYGKAASGLYQATGIPSNTGVPVQYEGSTTGPGYDEKGSPFQVTWSVRPHVAKVNIATVGKWCEGNNFKEDHGHGVRNLVVNPDLLSQIN
ncbi:MAG: delta-class carbonic anhydrase [Mariprofundus sp.]|nr:delta-class carbonic anhydrase [Mariprofundus sp.]